MNGLIARYGARNVPRYASYPTAAEFEDTVGPVDHERWLASICPDEPLSLYVHVPYCPEICRYCGRTTKMVMRDSVLSTYHRLIEREIVRVAEHLHAVPCVRRLHWGGGTPALLGIDGLEHIVEALEFDFNFVPDFEHAIELDPRGVSAELVRGLAHLGINRVNLGVQDLDAHVQEAIGRVQPRDVIEHAFARLREAGIANINVDLVYGLPHQTVGSVTETARLITSFEPRRIGCYGYAHLPEHPKSRHLIETTTFPDVAARFGQANAIATAFMAEGYEAIGIDHFVKADDPLARAARSGRLHRNFQGYTDDNTKTLIGFGASAISRFRDGYAQNASPTNEYAARIDAGSLATVRGRALLDEDRKRAAIIERLMCAFEVDLAAFGSPHEFADDLKRLDPLLRDGLVVEAAGHIAVTDRGRRFVRTIASVFDRYRVSEFGLNLAV